MWSDRCRAGRIEPVRPERFAEPPPPPPPNCTYRNAGIICTDRREHGFSCMYPCMRTAAAAAAAVGPATVLVESRGRGEQIVHTYFVLFIHRAQQIVVKGEGGELVLTKNDHIVVLLLCTRIHHVFTLISSTHSYSLKSLKLRSSQYSFTRNKTD